MTAATWDEWRIERPGPTPSVVITGDVHGRLDPTQLMKFAMAARVDLLGERTFDAGQWVPARPARTLTFDRTTLEARLGYPKRTFSKMFGPKGEVTTRQQVVEFEHRLLYFAHQQRSADRGAVRDLGWLSFFWDELGHRPGWLRTKLRNVADSDRAPSGSSLARWHADLCEAGPQNSAEALVLGETFLALLAASPSPSQVWSLYADQGDWTARALVSVSTRPPKGGAAPAIQLAAQLGERVLPIVREHVYRSGVGFRAIRVLTRMFYLAREGPPPWWTPNAVVEIEAARLLLRELAAQTQLLDPYPARSFLVESLREAAKLARQRSDQAWMVEIDGMLSRRLMDEGRPTRERAYAAYSLQELRGPGPGLTSVVESIGDDEFWSYLAVVLRMIDRGESVEDALLFANVDVPGRSIDELEEPLRQVAWLIREHLDTAGRGDDGALSYVERLPKSCQVGARQLVTYALMSPDGTARRRACETLHEAGVAREAAQVVAALLEDPRAPRWLQELSAFVLDYLEDPVCIDALVTVALENQRDPTVRHAALFALGDLRQRSDVAIDALLGLMNAPEVDPVRQAATYALAALRPRFDLPMSTQYRFDEQFNLLNYMATSDRDPLVRLLCVWGVETMQRTAARTDPVRRAESEIWAMSPLPART